MNTTYKANYKYNLIFLVGGVIFLLCLAFGGLETISGNFITGALLLLPAIIIFYFALYVIAKEVTVNEKTLIFKTQMSTLNLDYADIKDIKIFFSSKSLVWHSGDKEKASVLCAIILKKNPLRFFLFGYQINNYKELYSLIREKLKGTDPQ
ncbi:MAG: hypothetical protein SV375_11745 [Thermodesulfobacteriota bacterium]|nr:hypothetical protein [Thermodesulfobacteriota bacterium]